jgi:hypothetical protein
MMEATRRDLIRGMLLCLGLSLSGRDASAQPPPRLIADNKTPYLVDVLVWNGASWNFVMRLNPSHWAPFPNAQNGSVWRAVSGQFVREHTVRYVYDAGYGGFQSVWWIQ